MKKSFFKLFIALVLQTGIFFLFYKVLNIKFITSFIVSFNFIMLSSILVFGRSLTRNIYILPIVLANVLFIIIFFSIGNKAKLNNLTEDKSVIYKIESLKENFIVKYTKEESKAIRDIFYLITVGEYNLANNILNNLKKNLFIDEIETFLLKEKQAFEENFNKLQKYYINFDKIKEIYEKKEYQDLLDKLKPNLLNKDIEKIYNFIKSKIMATQNEEFLKTQMLVTINNFLNQAKDKSLIFAHLFSALPGLYKVYKESFLEYENKTITYRDFEGLKDSRIYNGVFTIVNYEGKKTILYIEKLLEPSNLYPLWGHETYMIRENKVLNLGITKIGTNNILYFERNKINTIEIPNIYNKIKNTPFIITTPFNPMWLFSYKKEYQEVYETMIKQFWILFLKFILTIFFSTIIIIITIDYFKIIFPTKMPYLFYLLPFLFLLILSFLYTNLSIRFINFIFKIL